MNSHQGFYIEKNKEWRIFNRCPIPLKQLESNILLTMAY